MGSLSHSIQMFVAAHGLEAVFVLMVLESACIPVPSEVTMIYAGYLVSQGDMSFVAAVVVGAFANLVGSWIAWAVGAYGVDAWLYRTERNRRHADQAHRWFERYGTPVVFFSRLVPIVRTFISLPAGVARMPLVRFSVLTFAAVCSGRPCSWRSAMQPAPPGRRGITGWAISTTSSSPPQPLSWASGYCVGAVPPLSNLLRCPFPSWTSRPSTGPCAPKIDAAIAGVLDSGRFILGPKGRALEAAVSERLAGGPASASPTAPTRW